MVDLQNRALRRNLVKSNDYILREKTIPFDFENPPVDPIDLRDIMMYNSIHPYLFSVQDNYVDD